MRNQPVRLLAAIAINFFMLAGSSVGGHAASAQIVVFTHGPGTCGLTMTGGTAWPGACQPVVAIEDATTLQTIDSSDQIALSITAPNQSGGQLVCSSGLTRNASNGTVDFAGCEIDKTGTYSLTATDNTTPGSAVTSPFSIVAGPTAQFGVTGLANPSTAGTAQSITVAAEDAGGNPASGTYAGTFTFASSDVHATLPAGSHGLSGNTGTFSVTLNTAGSQTVTATDTTTSSINGKDGPVTVNPGAVSSITISPTNASTSAGVAKAYSATAWDGAFGSGAGSGNEIGDVTTQTTFGINNTGTCTGGSGTNGAPPGNNQCGDKTAETDTVTATFSGKSASTSLTVSPGPGVLVFTAGPDATGNLTNPGFETGDFTGWTAGGTPAPTVSTAESYSGSHSALLGSTSGPSVPGDSTLTQAFTVPGTGTPMLTFLYWPVTSATSSDSQKAYVTCGGCASAENNVTVFNVLSNAQMWHPIQFDLSYAKGQSVDINFDVHQAGGASATAMYVDDVLLSGQAAGAAFGQQPQVQLEDALGNHYTTSGVMVTLALAPGAGAGTAGAGLSCTNLTVATDSSGAATFAGCKIDTTGYFYMLRATASTYGDGSSHPFSATGPILWFGTSPDNSTGGVAFSQQPVVHSLNGDGSVNTADGATGVTLGITPGTGASGAALTCTGGDGMTTVAGVASYSGCSVDKAASGYTLVASGTDGAVHAWPATSSAFNITAGPTAKFGVSGLANPSTAGASQKVTVTPEDAGGNPPSTAYGGAVYISFSPSGSGTSSPPNLSAGSCATACSFTVQLTRAGDDTVTAANASSSPTITGTETVPVNAGPTATLQVDAPSSAIAGGSFNVNVTALDAYGNTTTAYGGTVHFTSSDGAATLPSDSKLSNGAGTFAVTLNTAGSQTVTATDTVNGNITGHSDIQVSPGAPDHIAITPKSATTTAGTSASFSVTAYDAQNNAIGDVTSQTSFTISPNGSCTAGSGSGGSAPGNNQCSATSAGPHTVTASYQSKSDVASLQVNPGSTSSVTISPRNATTTAGTPVTYTATAFDTYGNTIGDVSSRASFTISPDGQCIGGSGSGGSAPGNDQCSATKAGRHTVTASFQSATDSTGLTVNPAGASAITISPQNAVTVAGHTVAYAATAYDTYGNSIGDVTGLTSFSINGGGSCTQGNGSTTPPGNNNCGGPYDASYTVTADYSGLMSSTTLTANDPGWVKLPGAAHDVGAWGSALYAIGTNPTNGGYGIWHYSGGGWASLPGGGVRVAVGPSGNPVLVNSSHVLYQWNGGGWQPLPGTANDVAVGGTGSDSIYVIGTNVTNGGYGIWHYSGGGWTSLPGGGVRIAVGPDGNPAVVNSSGAIYRWTGSYWQQLPGGGKDIGIGSDGSLWLLGTNAVNGGYGVYQWTGGGFSAVPGGGIGITVGSSGQPVLVNSVSDIYQRL